MKLRPGSLSAKLMLIAGGTISIIMIVAIGLLVANARRNTERLLLESAQSQAEVVAGKITAELAEAASAAKSMTGAIAAAQQTGMRDRQTIINMLKSNVDNYPNIFGSWMAERPRALDGRTGGEASGFAGSNKDGVFAPYWTKSASGGVDYSTFNVDYDAPWYKLASASGKGAITEPYIASEVKVLMSSIAYPIIVGGKELGVGGVDISLASLQQSLEALHPLGDGRVFLVSGSGNWLVAPDAGLRMKPMEGSDANAVREAMKAVTPRVVGDLVDGQGVAVTRVVLPFAVPDLQQTWATIVEIPTATLEAPARAEAKMLIIGGIVSLVTILAALWLATTFIVKRPLAMLQTSVDRLGQQDYATEVSNQIRGDEIGRFARALESFRHALASGREAEQLAEKERQQAERQRGANEAERAANAEEQGQVVAAVGKALSALADGDLTHKLDRAFPPAYEALRHDFNRTVERLRETIGMVRKAVAGIDSGSEEIASASQDLARRTEGQAASLEETAAALNEITARVRESADLAKAVAGAVRDARQDAERSGEIVHNTIEAMNQISASSDEIGKIIGVIDDIAFQTNLLALNAGVEAARAGEAGKGFAVVATEVRALAQRSADAAKQIKTLISSSAHQVHSGVELVGLAGQALERIAEQVTAMDGRVQSIAETAKGQAVGLGEVNVAVGQMDQVTQQNAAMVEEATAASQTLRQEAEALSRLVAAFKTADGAGGFASSARRNSLRAA
ncbi:methyl-accepting chemotaxis protein [Consotaella salsifontis]|uniref:Methyl-accepting chemotaxis sensory transducer with Cache sensor n=1 Tax=Consotaella salsifontis TaxID=1365950 RepID=A0A1T4NI34_9HYPH|nr:methyl-accepting chemotaxis protein [Consotaella salsifontis]SJZ78864.1 methyl-accepting chemotaxis sensory transducer with Cache sensor [Consotaella salsifontis]